MDYLSWFLTPTAVSIAWICTVLGFLLGIYGLVQKNEKNKLKVQCDKLIETNIELELKIVEINKNINKQEFTQHGKNNINTGILTGDIHVVN